MYEAADFAMKSIFLCHKNDLDGVASAAIYLLFSKGREDSTSIEFCGYGDYAERLEKVELGGFDEVTIADLNVNSSERKRIVNSLSRIAKKADVLYIDHHEGTAAAAGELRGACELIHSGKKRLCSAELAYKHFLPGNKTAERLAKLAHIADYPSDDCSEEERKLAERLDKVVKATPREELVRLARTLASGEFWNARLESIYGERLRQEKKERTLVPERSKVYRAGEFTLLCSHSPVLAASDVRKLLQKEGGADIYVGINDNDSVISMARGNDNIDVSAICSSLGGGGHEDRGGFLFSGSTVKNGEINHELVDMMLDAVERYSGS